MAGLETLIAKPQDHRTPSKKVFVNNQNNNIDNDNALPAKQQRGRRRIPTNTTHTTTDNLMARNTDAHEPATVRRSSRLGGSSDATNPNAEKEKNRQTRKRKRGPVKEEKGDVAEEGSGSRGTTTKRRRKSVEATRNAMATAGPSTATSTPAAETDTIQRPRTRRTRQKPEIPTTSTTAAAKSLSPSTSHSHPLPSPLPERVDQLLTSTTRVDEAQVQEQEESLPLLSTPSSSLQQVEVEVVAAVEGSSEEEDSKVEKKPDEEVTALTVPLASPLETSQEVPGNDGEEISIPTPAPTIETSPNTDNVNIDTITTITTETIPNTSNTARGRTTRSSIRNQTSAPAPARSSRPPVISTRQRLTRSSRLTRTQTRAHPTSTVVAASTGGAPLLEGEGRVLRARPAKAGGFDEKKPRKESKGKGKAKAKQAAVANEDEDRLSGKGPRKGKDQSKEKAKVEEAQAEVVDDAAEVSTNPLTSIPRSTRKPKPSLAISTTHIPTSTSLSSPNSPLSPLSPISPMDVEHLEPGLHPDTEMEVAQQPDQSCHHPDDSKVQAPEEALVAEAGPGPSTIAMRQSSSYGTIPGPVQGSETETEIAATKRETRSKTTKEKPRESARPYPSTRTRVTRSSGKTEVGAGNEVKGDVKKGKAKAKEVAKKEVLKETKGKGKGKANDVDVADGDAVPVNSTEPKDQRQLESQPRSSSPEVEYIRTRIKAIKSKGFDGNWDGREAERQRRLRESLGEMKSEVVEMPLDTSVSPALPTTSSETTIARDMESTSPVAAPSSEPSVAATASAGEVRRSSRTRTKSAKLVMSEEGELQTSVVKNRGLSSGKQKEVKQKVQDKGEKDKSLPASVKEKETATEQTDVSPSQTDADPSREPPTLSQPPPPPTAAPQTEADTDGCRGRSQLRESSGVVARSRSPSRSRSRRRSRSKSPRTTSSSSTLPESPSGMIPVLGQGVERKGKLLKSSPLKALGPLDTSVLERIDGLESAERVATPETPRSFTPMPTSSSTPTRNTVLVEAPGVPNSVVGLVGNDAIQNVLTHHESHGERSQSSAGSSGDEGSEVQAEMPRSVPDPIFGATSPTTGDTPPSSPPISSVVPEAATSQATPGSEPAQIPPDPLFQSSSGSDGFSWTGNGFHANDAYASSSPAPSTIAPNSPYISSGGFGPNDHTNDSHINPNFLPPPVNASNYSILINRLVISHMHDPQHPNHPRAFHLPHDVKAYHLNRPLPKPPCTGPAWTDPREIARPNLSPYPPYKWLTSFDKDFRHKGRGEHQYPQYTPCDFSTPAFADTSTSGSGGVRVGMVFRGRKKRISSRNAGRMIAAASDRKFLFERMEKPYLMDVMDGLVGVGNGHVVGLNQDMDKEPVAEAHTGVGGRAEEGEGEAMEEVVIGSQPQVVQKMKRQDVDSKKMRPRSSTSPYLRELFESGVERLMVTENVRWKTIRAVCEAEANEFWARHGLPRPWRVSFAGPWKKRELLHRGLFFPTTNHGFTHLIDPDNDNVDDMDYQNEPTYHWELASDEEEEADDEMPSSDIDGSSETVAEEQQVEENLLDSDSGDEDEDEDGDDDDNQSPVDGEMQLDIQAPVDQWNAPSEPTPQPMSISPASTLLSSSSFQPSSSSLADALTPPVGLSPGLTPAQLMAPPSPPPNLPSPGGMTYDFALSLRSHTKNPSDELQAANGAHVDSASTQAVASENRPPVVIGNGRDGVLQLPAPPLSRYFCVRQFDDSLNPFLFDPDRTSREFAEASKRSQQMQMPNDVSSANQRDEMSVTPAPFDYFSQSPSTPGTSITSTSGEGLSSVFIPRPVFPPSLPHQFRRRSWMRQPVRRQFPYYSERLGHISVGTSPDPNRLRQWALCAEEVERREKDKRTQREEAEANGHVNAGNEEQADDGTEDAKTRKGKKKPRAKQSTNGRPKAKGKSKAAEAEFDDNSNQADYDQEAALLRAVELPVAERNGQSDSFVRIGSSTWYEQRYQTDQMFPQGRISELPQWREMFRQAKAADARDNYGMYYQASEFQQGSSRDGYSATPNGSYAQQPEYYQQFDGGNLYTAQDHQQLEFSQDSNTHASAASPSSSSTSEDQEMTDEDAEGDADPDVTAPSQGYWPFLGSFGGTSSEASTATATPSNEAAHSNSSAPSNCAPPLDMNIDPLLQQQSSDSPLYPSIQQPPSATAAETPAQNQGQNQTRLQHVNATSGGGDVIGMLNMGLSVGHQSVVNMSGINVSSLSGMGLGVMGMNMGVGMGIEVGFGLVGGIMGGFGVNQNMDVSGMDVEPWYLSNTTSPPPAGMLNDIGDGQRSPPLPSVPSQSCSRSSSPASPILGIDVDPPSPGEQRLGSRSPSERESPHPLGFAMG